jgi:hypothetical protein
MGRYSNTLILKNGEGRRYYASNKYVEIPRNNNDLYVITTSEDRYDLLANQYYNDPSFWWVISSANPEYIGSMYPPSGVQIRIPGNLSFVLNALNINE